MALRESIPQSCTQVSGRPTGTSLGEFYRLLAASAHLLLATLVVLTAPACRPASKHKEVSVERWGEVATVRHPDVFSLQASVRESVDTGRRRVDLLLSERGTDQRELAGAFGELARTYQAYQLWEAARQCYANAALLDRQSFDWWYGLALVNESIGEVEGAIENYHRALAIDPMYPPAQLRLADLELASGQAERAGERFQTVVETARPAWKTAALFGVARAAIELGDDRRAEQHLLDVTRLAPDSGVARYVLAQVYRRLGKIGRAEQLLGAGSQGGVDFPDPFAESIAARASGASSLVSLANASLMAGKLEEAEQLFRRAIEGIETEGEKQGSGIPRDPAPYRNLAVTLQRQGKLAQSAVLLERAVTLFPGNANLLVDLGSARLTGGKLDLAAQSFRSAIAKAPDLVPARFGLANVLISQQQWAPAEIELGKLLAHEPGHLPARYQMAVSRLNQGDQSDGLARLLQLTEQHPEFGPARLTLAQSLMRAGNLGGARRQLLAALEHGENPRERNSVLTQLGTLDIRLGQIDDAIVHLSAALELVPTDPAAAVTLAGLWVQRGEHQKARVALEGALATDRQTPKVMHDLARLLATAKDDSVRDGARALDLARRAYLAQKSIDHAETVAMAMAETGDFQGAAAWQRGLLKRAQGMNRADLASRLQVNLGLYEAEQPVR